MKSQSDVTHDLGVEADHRMRFENEPDLDLNLQAGWVHRYSGQLSGQMAFDAFPGTAFAVFGTQGPKDAARIAAGAATDIANQLSAGIEAETLFAARAQSYGGNATLAYRW